MRARKLLKSTRRKNHIVYELDSAYKVLRTIHMIDYHISLGMVTDQLTVNNGLLLFGLLGVNPWSADDVLAEHGISCTGYWSYRELEQNLSNNDIIVFAVLNNASNIFDGAHFMAAQYTNGEFRVFNFSNKKSTEKIVLTLDPVYDNSVWIYGYIVGG